MLHDLLTYSNGGGSDAPGQMKFTKTFFPAKTLICFTHYAFFYFYFCKFFFSHSALFMSEEKFSWGLFAHCFAT